MNPIIMTIVNALIMLVIFGPLYGWLLENYPAIAIIATIGVLIYKGVTWINSKFAKMMELVTVRFDHKFESIDKRFHNIDLQFHKIDLHFEKMDSRFEKIEMRLDQHDVRLEVLENKVDKLSADVVNIEKRLCVVETKIDGITETVEKFDKRFDRIEDLLFTILDSNRKPFRTIRTGGSD
jgi:chromosome segregation ATPase